MNEATLTRSLVQKLRALPGAIVFKHSDGRTAGIPDLSVNYLKRTTWIEVKFANPKIITRGIQSLTIARLERCAIVYYVVYDKRENKIFIVEPHNVEDYRHKSVKVIDGFNHDLVVRFVRELHGEESEAAV